MSFLICLASDLPLREIGSCCPEDNFAVRSIAHGDDLQSKKSCLAAVEWGSRGADYALLLDYIRSHMLQAEEIELWHTWMGGGGEAEYPPLVKKTVKYLDELTVADIEEICKTDVFSSYFDNVDIGRQNCLLIRR